jgi:hypothetical protein
MEEVHQHLFHYFPTGSREVILEIIDKVQTINSLLENREKRSEIGQELRVLGNNFSIVFSTVQDVLGLVGDSQILAVLTTLREGIDNAAETTTLKGTLHHLRKQSVEFCRMIKGHVHEST